MNDVVVVGAGIIGAAIADRLSQEKLDLTLIDQMPPATGVTAAGMGHILVIDDSEPRLQLTRLSREAWLELAGESPPAVEFNRCGTIWLAETDQEMTDARKQQRRLHEAGVSAEMLTEAELREAEPGLREGLAGGLLVPDDGVLYQPAAARWLIDRAVARGARTIWGERVVQIESGEVRLGSGETLAARDVVCAAGLATPALLPEASIPSIEPRKGHLAITEYGRSLANHQLIELGYTHSAHGTRADTVAFNVQPRPGGQALIGSSRQFGTSDPEVDRSILTTMLDRAVSFIPGLANRNILRAWTGFRPATADGLPVIGRLPSDERTLVASGHEGLGITTAPITASLITSLILGHEPPVDPHPYRTDR